MVGLVHRRPTGARRLEDLCIALLTKYKSDVGACLWHWSTYVSFLYSIEPLFRNGTSTGNVGDLPLHTLELFLQTCEATELSSIEDCTRQVLQVLLCMTHTLQS